MREKACFGPRATCAIRIRARLCVCLSLFCVLCVCVPPPSAALSSMSVLKLLELQVWGPGSPDAAHCDMNGLRGPPSYSMWGGGGAISN